MSVSASVLSEVRVLHSKALDLSTYRSAVNKRFTKNLSSTDVTKVFHDQRTTTGESLDLTSGLTDAYGTSLVFATMKHLYIENLHASVSLTVGGGTTPALANAITVSAGGCLQLTSTFTIDSTHKLLAITPASGTLSYNIIVLGT